jgi:hypothetical protein
MSKFTKKNGDCSFDKNICGTVNCQNGNHRNPKSRSYKPSAIEAVIEGVKADDSAVKPSEEVLICQGVGSKPPINTGAMSNVKVGGGSPQEKTHCRFFNNGKGHCRNGEDCKFSHYVPVSESLETDDSKSGSEEEEEIEDTPFEHFLEMIISKSGYGWKITYEDDRKFAAYCELFSKFNAEQQRLLIVLILNEGLGKALLEDGYLSSKELPTYFDVREYDNEVLNYFLEFRMKKESSVIKFYHYNESCDRAFAKATINLTEEEAEPVKIFAGEYHMYLNTWSWEEDGKEDDDE